MKIENLTYLSLVDAVKLLNNHYSKDEIIDYLEQGKLKGIQMDGQWYVQKCSVSFLKGMLENKSLYERIHFGGAIGIDLTHIQLNGRTLDIGGGGEGIISQLNPNFVEAIDMRKDELEEASIDSLKIIMDAKDLKFLDSSFDYVTSFFTLMYIPNHDHAKVFEEAYRVLKPGGTFMIWDTTIPSCQSTAELYAVFLEIQMPEKLIETGYGVPWLDRQQDLDYFINLAQQAGFKDIQPEVVNDFAFSLLLTK